MQYAPLVDRVASRGAASWGVHFDALARRAAGEDIILLTVGDPDQSPPALVIDTAIAALGRRRTGYSPITGHAETLAAIAERHARRTGQPCGPENIAVVAGAQAGLYFTLQCIAGPGDEVIVPEPMYVNYEAVVTATGAAMVKVPSRPEAGFHPDLDALAAAITPATRAIWINSPHNPTGAVMTPAEIGAIAALCREHDLWLVSDEVYEDLAFARPHLSPWSLPGMAARTVVISSLSKSHALPGFRFGWVVGPPDLIGHLFNLLLCALYGGPPFIQDAVLPALRADLPQVANLREDYRRRSSLMTGILAGAPGCRVRQPEGGMFVLLDIRPTGLTSEAFAHGLLDQERVAVLPCDASGPSAAGHLRISLTTDDAQLAEAGRRIVRFAATLAQAPVGA
jgi:arginine:pyruvate transaminase